MDVQIWADVSVAVQTELGAAKVLAGVTKGAETILQCADHGFADGAPVLVRARGIGALDYAVGIVDVVDDDSFKLLGIDSTGMRGSLIAGSTVRLVTFGAEAETLQEITPSGGEAADVNIETIHPHPNYSVPGKPTPIVYSFGSLWVPTDPALVALKAAAGVREVCAVRFQWADGTQLLFAGSPSASMAPGGSSGQAVTTPLKINVRGPLATLAGAEA
ncbi:hypothetical protein ABIC63_005609 [Pseudacidovorax sp. 1753]|uniref:phage tail tube protein n=1 Tax=Pseudacidovorax sp. 1753 TaxID=3156419 RepID=UPI0033923788